MCKTEWIRCPICGNKTRLQIRTDTELKNFPLYCPKCKQETLIEGRAVPSGKIPGAGAPVLLRGLQPEGDRGNSGPAPDGGADQDAAGPGYTEGGTER